MPQLSSSEPEEGVGPVSLAQTHPMCIFITSSSEVIYGSHTGHSSELFLSAEDKKKIMALLPRRRGSVYTAERLKRKLQQDCITDQISLFKGKLSRVEEANVKQD